MVFFASVILVIIGSFNLIYGIAAVAHARVFVANAHYVFANLSTWGWITLILGVLLLAAVAVVAGSQLARWFGVAVLGLNAIDMMFFVPAYPFWALVIIAADVVAIYGLCAYGSRATWKPPNRALSGTSENRGCGRAAPAAPPGPVRRARCPVQALAGAGCTIAPVPSRTTARTAARAARDAR
jgi:hypothetical protein